MLLKSYFSHLIYFLFILIFNLCSNLSFETASSISNKLIGIYIVDLSYILFLLKHLPIFYVNCYILYLGSRNTTVSQNLVSTPSYKHLTLNIIYMLLSFS